MGERRTLRHRQTANARQFCMRSDRRSRSADRTWRVRPAGAHRALAHRTSRPRLRHARAARKGRQPGHEPGAPGSRARRFAPPATVRPPLACWQDAPPQPPRARPRRPGQARPRPAAAARRAGRWRPRCAARTPAPAARGRSPRPGPRLPQERWLLAKEERSAWSGCAPVEQVRLATAMQVITSVRLRTALHPRQRCCLPACQQLALRRPAPAACGA